MQTNTVTLHRVIKASPEKIYKAFTSANAMAAWIPPYGFLCEVHSMDVKVGGSFKMSFTNFSTSHSHSFGGNYLAIKPNEFIQYSDKFDDPHLPREMITSVTLKQVSCETEVNITQSGIPTIIPAEMYYLGWQE